MRRSLLGGSILMLFLVGCRGGSASSGAAGIAAWQRGVEQYLVARNNDPDALRDVTLEDSRRGFAVLGGLDPREVTDERALLLAHKTIADKPWFIYAVGVVKKDQVQDIRLVALSTGSGQTIWRVGERDPQAFKQYRDAALNDWRQHATGGDRAKPPQQYTTFPRAADVFDVVIDGTIVRATHVASGAVFAVDTARAPTASKKTKKR